MELNVRHLQPDPKTGLLRYRRVFPVELRSFIESLTGKARSELKVSLRARSITEPGAMARYEAAHTEFERVVGHARKAAAGAYDRLDGPLIAYLVEKYRVEALAADEKARWDPALKARGEMVTTALEQAGYVLPEHRPTSRWTLGTRTAIDAVLEVYRALAADGDVEGIMHAWSTVAASLAASSGYFVDQSGPAFRELCIKLNEAAIAVHEAELQRMDGQVVPTPEMPRPPAQSADARARAGRSFSEIVLELVDKPRLAFAEPTKERVRGALRFLEEAVGNLRPAELTRERVTEWLDLLAQRPSKLPKADYHLKLQELAARYADRPEVSRLTQKTMEAYNLVLNARWREAQAEGYIPKTLASPFADRKFRREVGRSRTAKGFTPDELKAYFSLPVFAAGERPWRGKGEAVFWLPLVLLFTGARPEEAAQLLVADVYQDGSDGRWVIRFTDEGEHPAKGRQSLKTERVESGRRAFPVPQSLLDLGLVDYIEHLKARGETALFPLLRRKGKRSGIYASFGEWFCEYLDAKGVILRGTGRQPVRELRHTWTTAARASRIPREAQEYMQGHRPPGGGSAHEGYGERQALGDWIDQLKFQVDVAAIVPRWTAPE